MKKKVVYIVSHVQKSLAFEWITEELKNDFQLTFILLNPDHSSLELFLKNHGIPFQRILYRSKKDFLTAFVKIFFYLLKHRPQVIHAHLIDAQLLGLTVGWFLRIRNRIYTRHTSNFHHVYVPQGVKYDRWSNRFATVIISVSQATDGTLLELEKVPQEKVIRIPHGFNLSEFYEVPADRIDHVKSKWGIPNAKPIVGVIARHIEWKGIQYIIPAFKEFLQLHPEACLILANTSGPYHKAILKLLQDIPEQNVILIPFEEDVAALYKLFDLYVHVPVDSMCEAFGQTYVEALASGVPSVFTLSGIAAEFIEHKKHAWVVKFKSKEEIYLGLTGLWHNENLRKVLIENGLRVINPRFDIQSMVAALRSLYDR